MSSKSTNKIYDSIDQTIGNTPMVRLNRVKKHFKLHGDIIAKLVIDYDGDVSKHDLLASQNIKKKNIISRIIKSINYLIWGDV